MKFYYSPDLLEQIFKKLSNIRVLIETRLLCCFSYTIKIKGKTADYNRIFQVQSSFSAKSNKYTIQLKG